MARLTAIETIMEEMWNGGGISLPSPPEPPASKTWANGVCVPTKSDPEPQFTWGPGE